MDTQFLIRSSDQATGAAAIIVRESSGDNAIIVAPGAANALTCEEIDRARDQIAAVCCVHDAAGTACSVGFAWIEDGASARRPHHSESRACLRIGQTPFSSYAIT